MKFTLKDYQDEAVLDVLDNLRKARKRWREDGDRHAFSLTAATGAGKTVMAAAVFEALFHGDDGYDFDRDPRRGGDLVQRRPVAQRADPLPADGIVRPPAAHGPGGGGKHLQPREVRRRARSTSSTRRSWARRVCWCAASTPTRMTASSRKCGPTCGATRSGTRSATPSKTRR